MAPARIVTRSPARGERFAGLASGMSDASPVRGAAAGLAAALLFGLSTPVAKLLLPATGPFLLAGLLYLGAGLALALAAPFRGAGREAPLRRADLPTLAGLVVAGGIAGPVLLLLGLARLPGRPGLAAPEPGGPLHHRAGGAALRRVALRVASCWAPRSSWPAARR